MHSVVSPAQRSNPPLQELPSNVLHSHFPWAPAQTFMLSIYLPEPHLHGGSLKPSTHISILLLNSSHCFQFWNPAYWNNFESWFSLGYRRLPNNFMITRSHWSRCTCWTNHYPSAYLFVTCRRSAQSRKNWSARPVITIEWYPPRVSCDVLLVSFRIHLVFGPSLKKWVRTTVCCKMHRMRNRPHRVRCYFQ